jgi:large subunit ribosomal protein L10
LIPKEVNALPISREEKEELVEQLTEQFQKSRVIVWAEYRGLATPSLNELRRALRPHEAEFHVIKNTLAGLALKRAEMPVSDEMLAGPTAAGVVYGDIAAAARALSEFASANREFVIKGGQAGQRLLAADEVKELANLPSREVLLARVLGGMNAPVSGLVTVLSGTLRGLLNVLQAQARKLEEAGA